MALFKSGVIASASGSIGGWVFSHNRGGMYIRQRTTPTDPGSAPQVSMRNAMGALTTAWVETLTDAQRESWANYAANVSLLNPFGDPRYVTALNMFVRSNSMRQKVGETIINTAPSIFDLGTATPMSINSITAPSTVSVAYEDADDWVSEDGAHLLVFLSRPKSPTINFFKNPYQYAGKIDGDSVTPPASPQNVTSPFVYDDVTAQKVFAFFRVIRADGRMSTPFRASALTA